MECGTGFQNGVGGKTALEYLIKVENYSFIDAVKHLINLKHISVPENKDMETSNTKTKLVLPDKFINNNRVKKYLISRGIQEDIINKCIANKMIYEDIFHNVVFVGYDENNVARYAGARATNTSRFMHDITGSSKEYSFMLESNEKVKQIHVFEGAIDLLSFASLLFLKGLNYNKYTLISLAGVYQPAKIIENSKVPKTIERYLQKHNDINELILHFDNDLAGKNATIAFQKVIDKKYKITNSPPPYSKDMNEYLCRYLSCNSINKKEYFER